MKINKYWILFSFFNFLIASLMGLILRGAFIWELDWLDYRNMMHGHSHVAMLGWIYLALYILIGHFFLPKKTWAKPIYTWLFWFTQMTVMGMMISFPIQGYGAVSITFSTLHILASYLFCYLIWRDQEIKSLQIALLLKTSIVLLVISTLGIWSLGPIAALGGRGSTFYQLAIQFYLHFQFHGWFTFSVLALILSVLSQNSPFNRIIFNRFYVLLLASVILTYGLVLEWGLGGSIPLLLNALGLVLQLAALVFFLKLKKENSPYTSQNVSLVSKTFFGFGLLSWMFKIIVQSVVLVPSVAVVSFTIRSLMIGFIHLTMLGFVSGLLFALIFGIGNMAERVVIIQAGKYLFIIGFVLSEFILFVQGLFYWFQWGQIPAFHELIFGTSALLPLSILLIIIYTVKFPVFKHYPNLTTA
ncbi:MAG TPA: hypothetical protein VK957_09280 [Lunatimonas sp.]|nr:hypothetical protein [Lunatimonas sp.]